MQEEYETRKSQHQYIIGADECGYGSWAGPVVTCAVAVPSTWTGPKGLNDSKKLSAKKRQEFFESMRYKVEFSCEMAEAQEIDREGILPTLHKCFRTCLGKLLQAHPDALVVVDGEVKLSGVNHLHFPRADGIVPAVMAASVIGKVLHDKRMVELGNLYPGYGLGVHLGYGTKEHQVALAAKGPSPCHRRSYAPIKKALGLDPEEGISVDTEVDIDLSEL